MVQIQARSPATLQEKAQPIQRIELDKETRSIINQQIMAIMSIFLL